DDYLVTEGAARFRELKSIDLKHKAWSRASNWWREWKSRHSSAEGTEKKQGQSLMLADPEAWPEPVDGAVLLDDLVAIVKKYVVLPDGAAEASALWVLHTYCIEALDTSPILAITSPQRRCGKTTLLTVLGAAGRRAISASNIS